MAEKPGRKKGSAGRSLRQESEWLGRVQALLDILNQGQTLTQAAAAIGISSQLAHYSMRDFLREYGGEIDTLQKLKCAIREQKKVEFPAGQLVLIKEKLETSLQSAEQKKSARKERAEEMIVLQRDGFTWREIASKLDTAVSSARLIYQECQMAGQETFDTVVALREAIHLLSLSLSVSRLKSWCMNGYVVFEKRRRHFVLTNEGLAELVFVCEGYTKRTCEVCKAQYELKRYFTSRSFCSTKCRVRGKHLERVARGEYLNPPNESMTPYGWYADLVLDIGKCRKETQALGDHQERWVMLAEARRSVGFSKMQLVYLRRRQMVLTREHPTKKWRGQPVIEYALSELKIAKRVYDEWCQKKSQGSA